MFENALFFNCSERLHGVLLSFYILQRLFCAEISLYYSVIFVGGSAKFGLSPAQAWASAGGEGGVTPLKFSNMVQI